MTDAFISVLNMSITASYVILAVILLRLLLKKTPKKYSYLLWSVVGFRLCCPVSFKSVFSLFNLKPFDMTQIQSEADNSLKFIQDSNSASAGNISSGLPAADSFIYDEITSTITYEENIDKVLFAISLLWITVIIFIFTVSLIDYIKLRKRLSTAIRLENNIFYSENISTPFIAGIVKPKIYIPSSTDENYKEYIILHERIHLKRFDNIVKLAAFILLTLHWFNPLCHLAFYLMNKDMEMSCDEAVLSKNSKIKKLYGSALLSFATDKKFPAPSPLSFSEGSVKSRIKNVLSFKKPKAIISAIAIMLCLAVLICCCTNPKEIVTKKNIETAVNDIANYDSSLEKMIANAIRDNEGDIAERAEYFSESYRIFDTKQGDLNGKSKDSCETVYFYVYASGLTILNKVLKEESGACYPCAIVYSKNNGKYSFKEYWTPRDGSYYAKDIKKYFSTTAYIKLQKFENNHNNNILIMKQELFAKAVEKYNIDINLSIEALIETICVKYNMSSAMGGYKDKAPEEFDLLLEYGDYSLKYAYTEFLKGNQEGEKADIMYDIMFELLGGEVIKYAADNPQDYFNSYLKHNQELLKKNGSEFMKSNYPKGYMLLEMTTQ